MGIFGWSYPPGCSGPPEEDCYCWICGEPEHRCICPECSFCGTVGDPDCYVTAKDAGHWMIISDDQIQRMKENTQKWEDQDRREFEYFATLDTNQ